MECTADDFFVTRGALDQVVRACVRARRALSARSATMTAHAVCSWGRRGRGSPRVRRLTLAPVPSCVACSRACACCQASGCGRRGRPSTHCTRTVHTNTTHRGPTPHSHKPQTYTTHTQHTLHKPRRTHQDTEAHIRPPTPLPHTLTPRQHHTHMHTRRHPNKPTNTHTHTHKHIHTQTPAA